jgi:hypothetical protein
LKSQQLILTLLHFCADLKVDLSIPLDGAPDANRAVAAADPVFSLKMPEAPDAEDRGGAGAVNGGGFHQLFPTSMNVSMS